jgi:iron complex transport system substrate-binding protein
LETQGSSGLKMAGRAMTMQGAERVAHANFPGLKPRASTPGLFARKRIALASAALLILGIATKTPAALESSSRAATAPDYRTVIDDVGREVKMPAQVNRIVTLAPNLTEIVYALGLGDKLAGDTNECDNPPAAKSKPHVGEPQNPSLEAILALHPDLVLAADSINRVDTADALQRLGIAVYTAGGDTQSVLGILDSIAKMGDVMGAKTQGDELVAGLRQRLDALHARLEDRPMAHVLFVVWLDPLITIGQNTFIADALRWAGAESVVLSKQNWPQISIEEVVRLQPDYIVFAAGHAQSAAAELADLRGRPVWRDLDAVELGHIVNLEEEAIRPAPGLVDAIEQLAHDVHPEAFSQKSEFRNSKSENRLVLVARFDQIAGCNLCDR